MNDNERDLILFTCLKGDCRRADNLLEAIEDC